MPADNRRESARLPRVCLLTPTFYPVVGGGETHASLLANQLNKLGAETFVLTRRTIRRHPKSEVVGNTPTCRLPPTGMQRLGKWAMVPFVYRELIRRRNDYDVVMVCAFTVLGIPAVTAARKLGKPCVLRAESIGEMSGGYASVHGGMHRSTAALFGGWVAWRNRRLGLAHAFVSISGAIRDEFIGCEVAPEKIAEIPNGIDLGIFRPCSSDRKAALRRELTLPPTGPIVVYTGKLNKRKGLENLLESWTKVSSVAPGSHLLLVGSGAGQSISCEDELRLYVREHKLSSVIFTGYVTNVHEYLQASDIFAFPTEYEAFGLSLVEAMSCGLPVVASRVGGIPEIVTHERTGLLVEPGRPDMLTEAILGLLRDADRAQAIATAGRALAQERYSIQSVAARYCDLFSSLHARDRASDRLGTPAR